MLNLENKDGATAPSIADETLPMVFPKKFEKQFGDYLDKQFLLVLAGSLFLHFLVILFFIFNPPSLDVSEKEIEIIQERFAKLVLDKPKPTPKVAKPLPEKEDNIAKVANNTSAAPAPKAKAPKPAAKKVTPRTAEARQKARGTKAASRKRSRAQLKKAVSNKGILALLTSNSSSASGGAAEDVLGKKIPNGKLNKALAGVTGLKKAGAGEKGSSGKTRGSRETNRGGGLGDLVMELGKSEAGGVSRSGELEVDAATSLLGEGGGAVQGSRDNASVAAIVQTHNAAVQYCYQRELRRNPGLKGKIVVRFTIVPAGSVKDVTIVSSSIGSSRIENCIVGRIKRWNDFGAIDKSLGDTTIRQVYTFGY